MKFNSLSILVFGVIAGAALAGLRSNFFNENSTQTLAKSIQAKSIENYQRGIIAKDSAQINACTSAQFLTLLPEAGKMIHPAWEFEYKGKSYFVGGPNMLKTVSTAESKMCFLREKTDSASLDVVFFIVGCDGNCSKMSSSPAPKP